MSGLSQKHCAACEGEVPALTPEQAKDLMAHIPEWTLSERADRLTRAFTFKDFAKAHAFVNEVAKLAEEEWHHPTITYGWGKVELTFSTHSVRGLTENDFIMAAKVHLLPR